MSDAEEVERAALALIDFYAANDLERYFAEFTPEASFIFPSSNTVFASAAEYRAAWQGWIDELNFKVLSCTSTARAIQVYGDTAVFTHETDTRLSIKNGEQTLLERETIILRKISGRWRTVHEHVSPLPG